MRCVWNIKGLILLISVVVLLIASLHPGFSHQKRFNNCKGPSVQSNEPSIRSYIWMDYIHRDRPLQYWIKIEKSGDACYVRYDNFNRIEKNGIAYPKILESRSGKFSSTEIQNLFELIDKKGFYLMKPRYDSENTEVLSEDDILTVCVSIRDKTKTVYARPPSFIPEQLTDIVEAIREKILDLKEDGKLGVFLRAEVLNETRLKSLARERKLTLFSEKQLKDCPYLKEAIENPGQFVYAGPWEIADIDPYISKYSFFFVSTPNGYFGIDVFLREKL